MRPLTRIAVVIDDASDGVVKVLATDLGERLATAGTVGVAVGGRADLRNEQQRGESQSRDKADQRAPAYD